MNYTIVTLCTLAIATFLFPAMALMAADSVIITDSGSTNTAGFRIEVRQSGEADYTPIERRPNMISTVGNKPMSRQIPSAVLKRFLADLNGVKPFTALPNQGCMKSASFGTTLMIEYQGQKTPDLNCGDRGNEKLKALIQDCGDIVRLFHEEAGRDTR